MEFRMGKFVKIFSVLVVIFLFNGVARSQVSVSYYSSSLEKIGIGYEFSDKLWGEFRLYGNMMLENFTPEIVLCYDIMNISKSNLYVGIGGNVNFFAGIVLPVGVQFTPLEAFDNFSLHFEFQPMIDFMREGIILQTSWV
jgi:hypothetical protein